MFKLKKNVLYHEILNGNMCMGKGVPLDSRLVRNGKWKKYFPVKYNGLINAFS